MLIGRWKLPITTALAAICLFVVSLSFSPIHGVTAANEENGTRGRNTQEEEEEEEEGNNICWIVYQMADNDLEQFVRKDNTELVGQSEIIKDPKMTTWVYFDSRNYLDTWEDIYEPLPFVYNRDGETLMTEKYEGSLYMTYHHELGDEGRMVVDQMLPGEQDGDSPTTLSNFLVYALTDCIANKGSNDFILTFASHGGGFAGYGGDEHWQRRRKTKNRRRELTYLQPNQSIVQAIQEALQTTKTMVPNPEAVPEKFNVIGFDSCSMQAFGSLDEYREVADLVIGSEAVEPGHGWAYAQLVPAQNTEELAIQIVNNFIDQPQNEYNYQYSPKTLSIVHTQRFARFMRAWEDLMEVLANLLEANDDVHFYTFLQRVRAQSVSFEGFGDDFGTATPSALDIGSFLYNLQDMCQPVEDGTINGGLADALHDAIRFYDRIFELRRVGQGTPEGTGMHIMFPMKAEFNAYNWYWTQRLFDEANYQTTLDAPNYRRFLQLYYYTPAPVTDRNYVCQISAESGLVTNADAALLLNPSLTVEVSRMPIRSEIKSQVHEVVVEYGIDLSTVLQEILHRGGGSRTLQQQERATTASPTKEQKLRELLTKTKERDTTQLLSHTASIRRTQRIATTNYQGDYLLYYGGQIRADYNQSGFEAVWDRKFWGLIDTSHEEMEAIYVFDKGNGARAIPVLYFPPNLDIDISKDDLLPVFTIEEGKALGGQYSLLTFSVDPSTNEAYNNLILYTGTNDTSFSETPRNALGHIVPIIYVESELGGFHFNTLVGGVLGTAFEWNPTTELTVVAGDIGQILEDYGLDNYVIDVVAYDRDTSDTDYFNFRLDSQSRLMKNFTFQNDILSADGHNGGGEDEEVANPTVPTSASRSSFSSRDTRYPTNALFGVVSFLCTSTLLATLF